MQQPIRIISRSNKRLYADAIPGHFATNHSHINYYIDMSEIKHNMSMALEAARSIAFRFSSVSVDTLLCLEGTEYIGAYVAALNGVDAIAFTAGIGENAPIVRTKVCEYLGYLGIALDEEQNNKRGEDLVISTPDSKVKVCIIPTNEELAIARETVALVG